MLQSLLMFLAPASAQAQATTNSPPALAEVARKRPARKMISWKLAACVLANGIGFLALLAGCWAVLQLMQVLLIP